MKQNYKLYLAVLLLVGAASMMTAKVKQIFFTPIWTI
jgi:hypothetical protein